MPLPLGGLRGSCMLSLEPLLTAIRPVRRPFISCLYPDQISVMWHLYSSGFCLIVAHLWKWSVIVLFACSRALSSCWHLAAVWTNSSYRYYTTKIPLKLLWSSYKIDWIYVQLISVCFIKQTEVNLSNFNASSDFYKVASVPIWRSRRTDLLICVFCAFTMWKHVIST